MLDGNSMQLILYLIDDLSRGERQEGRFMYCILTLNNLEWLNIYIRKYS